MNSALTIQGPPPATQPRTLAIDPSRSRIEFRLRWLGPIAASGSVGGVAGTLVLDELHPERSSVRATVDLATINTGIALRDRHLRAADFFDVERYPQARFASERIEQSGANRWQVSGRLRLRGVERPVVLDTEYVDMGDGAVRFTATAEVSRKDFGIHIESRMNRVMLGDAVRLTLSITAAPAG